MIAQPPANIQPVTARNHDVQKKQRRRLTLGVGNEIGGRVIDAGRKTSRLQMMLNETGDIRIVLKHKNSLTQQIYPQPRDLLGGWPSHAMQEDSNAGPEAEPGHD